MVHIYGSTKRVVGVFMQCFIFSVDFCCRYNSSPMRKTNIAAENVPGNDKNTLQHIGPPKEWTGRLQLPSPQSKIKKKNTDFIDTMIDIKGFR
jgi:hypothetical protein